MNSKIVISIVVLVLLVAVVQSFQIAALKESLVVTAGLIGKQTSNAPTVQAPQQSSGMVGGC